MLHTDSFPRANEIWEDLPGANRTWVRWKTIYRKAGMANKVKKSAKGGQDHFGSHGAFDKVINAEGPEALTQLSLEELNEYFSSLANEAITEKDILSVLVRSNDTLTTSNASLTPIVSNLQKQLANMGKTPTPHREPNRQRRTCPICTKEVYHAADEYYELKKNSHMRHPGWRSQLM